MLIIHLFLDDLNKKYSKYRRHISVCNNENLCETAITFPRESVDVEIQYIGDSDVSTKLSSCSKKLLDILLNLQVRSASCHHITALVSLSR